MEVQYALSINKWWACNPRWLAHTGVTHSAVHHLAVRHRQWPKAQNEFPLFNIHGRNFNREDNLIDVTGTKPASQHFHTIHCFTGWKQRRNLRVTVKYQADPSHTIPSGLRVSSVGFGKAGTYASRSDKLTLETAYTWTQTWSLNNNAPKYSSQCSSALRGGLWEMKNMSACVKVYLFSLSIDCAVQFFSSIRDGEII